LAADSIGEAAHDAHSLSSEKSCPLKCGRNIIGFETSKGSTKGVGRCKAAEDGLLHCFERLEPPRCETVHEAKGGRVGFAPAVNRGISCGKDTRIALNLVYEAWRILARLLVPAALDQPEIENLELNCTVSPYKKGLSLSKELTYANRPLLYRIGH
jgi:hypothetical protein